MVRRTLIIALLCIAAGTAAVVVAPWHRDAGGDELAVERATLRPGTIALELANDSEDTARIAQVIVNDAYVDFDATRRVLSPRETGTVAVDYPWIRGESYEIELLLSTGNALMYEIDEAAPGDVASA